MKNAHNRSVEFSTILQTLITSTKLLQEASEEASVAVPSGPLVGVAIDRLETIKALKANKDVGEELAEKIVHQVSTIYHELSRPDGGDGSRGSPSDIREAIGRYTNALTEAHDALDRLSQRGLLSKSILRGRDRRELQSVTASIDMAYDLFMGTVGKKQNSGREGRRSMVIHPSALPELPPSPTMGRSISPARTPLKSASFQNQHFQHIQQSQYSYCWPGTRIPLLNEIDDWAGGSSNTSSGSNTNTNSNNSSRMNSSNSLIYWLVDVPGSGKTTVAAHLSEEWKDKGILGGFYSFPMTGNGSGDVSEAESLCEVWAAQLGEAFPELTGVILRALSEHHRSHRSLNSLIPTNSASTSTSTSEPSRNFSQQLKTLILQPINHLRKNRPDLPPHFKVIFVLDSLDKCPVEKRGDILQGVMSVNSSHGVKFLLTSRLPISEEDNDIAMALALGTGTSVGAGAGLSEKTESTEHKQSVPPETEGSGSTAPTTTNTKSIITRGSINVNSASNIADVLHYLTTLFQRHSSASQFQSNPQFRAVLGEPNANVVVRALSRKAEGLILWAKVAFDMLLSAENPTLVLLNLMEEDSLGSLNGLYLELLLQVQGKLDRLNEAVEKAEKGKVLSPTSKDKNKDQEKNKGKSKPKEVTSELLPQLDALAQLASKQHTHPESKTLVFPKNTLATVLAAIGSSFEPLSPYALVEFTGLGLGQVFVILQWLDSVIESPLPPQGLDLGLNLGLDPSLSLSLNLASIMSPTSIASAVSPLSTSTSINPSSYTSPSESHNQKKKRASSLPRKSSFSPHRNRANSTHKSSHKATGTATGTSAGTSGTSYGRERSRSSAEGVIGVTGITGRGGRERGSSGTAHGGLLLTPLAIPHPTHSQVQGQVHVQGTVQVRHSTFFDWIRLPHPPTLISSLIGKNVPEESDFRFMIAPSREGGHANLARNSLSIIKSVAPASISSVSATLLDLKGGSPEDATPGGPSQLSPNHPSSKDKDGKDEDAMAKDTVAYSCRFWASHCAELITIVQKSNGSRPTSHYYGNQAGSATVTFQPLHDGTRWTSLREDMMEFFTHRLVWWADTIRERGWSLQGIHGLRRLRAVLQDLNLNPDEEMKATVDELIAWIDEALVYIDNPHVVIKPSTTEPTLSPPSSTLLWKHYNEELTKKATELALAEEAAATAAAAAEAAKQALANPPPGNQSHITGPDSLEPAPKTASTFTATSAASAATAATAASATSGSGHALSTSTKVSSPSDREERGEKGAEGELTKLLLSETVSTDPTNKDTLITVNADKGANSHVTNPTTGDGHEPGKLGPPGQPGTPGESLNAPTVRAKGASNTGSAPTVKPRDPLSAPPTKLMGRKPPSPQNYRQSVHTGVFPQRAAAGEYTLFPSLRYLPALSAPRPNQRHDSSPPSKNKTTGNVGDSGGGDGGTTDTTDKTHIYGPTGQENSRRPDSSTVGAPPGPTPAAPTSPSIPSSASSPPPPTPNKDMDTDTIPSPQLSPDTRAGLLSLINFDAPGT